MSPDRFLAQKGSKSVGEKGRIDVGRGSTEACKAKGSAWFRSGGDGSQLPTSMQTQAQRCRGRLSGGAALPTLCEECYLTRGKVWAGFTSFASAGSKAEAELPE